MWRGTEDGGPGARGALNVDGWRREAAPSRAGGALDLADGPDVRTAFGSLLRDWPWETFTTWTFRDRCGPVKAEREVREWLRWLAYQHRAPFAWMFGTEQEPGADRPHAHGLLIGTRGVRWEPLWSAWYARNGAMRTEAPRDGDAVTFYCTKYVAKRGEVYFSDNLHEFRAGARPARAGVRPGEQFGW